MMTHGCLRIKSGSKSSIFVQSTGLRGQVDATKTAVLVPKDIDLATGRREIRRRSDSSIRISRAGCQSSGIW